MVTTEEYLAQIAREEAANLRARAEGYESAAHKEAHANTKPGNAGVEGGAAARERAANERAKQVTDPRTGLKFQSASDMEAYANERAQNTPNPATGKMFTSAVDQEIDANRRARLNKYLNAADYESGLRTRSYDDFVDPRDAEPEPIPEQFAIGTANDIKWNPDQPDHVDYDKNWRDNYPDGFDVHGNPIQYETMDSCFVDGVQVELVDGSEKNVSEISVGDEVKTDKGDGVVTKIYPSKAGGQKLYGFNDKEPFVTEAHPFMTQDGWKKISDVTEGDTLYRNGRGIVTVESITSKEIPEDTPVYNFHVDGHETYFADGYLVHNKWTAGDSSAKGSMDLAAFRPWTQTYWSQFMPKADGKISTNSLLYMQAPQQEYGLAYLPGEMRDPAHWNLWEGTEGGKKGHTGSIPGGGWRRTPTTYNTMTGTRAGKKAPWKFTAEGGKTNIYASPWSASQMNLTPGQGAKWKGLLTGLDTAPAIDTSVASLLGVK